MPRASAVVPWSTGPHPHSGHSAMYCALSPLRYMATQREPQLPQRSAR